MSEAQLKRIFTPFSQGDSSVNRRYGGTGLGLVITKRLVQMMGGKVWVESEEGHGSKFQFTVVMNTVSDQEKELLDYSEASTSQPPQINLENLGLIHPLRILLAEDSPVNQKVALYLLERMSYRADVAANGLETLEALQRQPYDVILMDIQMPEMDGIEAASRIREMCSPEKRPHIIVLTAHALSGDKDRFLAAGMEGYITKPIRIQELAKLLRDCPPINNDPMESGGMPIETMTDMSTVASTDDYEPAINAATMSNLRESMADEDGTAMLQLAEIFLDYAIPLVGRISESIDQHDREALRRHAHALKSSSGNVAALRLAQICLDMETYASTGDMTSARDKLPELEHEFARVTEAINQIISGIKNQTNG